MQRQNIGKTSLSATRIAYGCMPLGGTWDDAPVTDAVRAVARRAIDAALESGIDFFDHADIYCQGKSEQVFAEALKDRPSVRQRIVIQSKCGIRLPGDAAPFTVFDWSREHIVRSVEAILRRLDTDYLDILLLHRPDPLFEPEEVAHAFDALGKSGKVRHFGVSNTHAGQIALLEKHLPVPIVANQLELNLWHHGLIEEAVNFNQRGRPMGTAGTLEYCRLRNITVQAWAPLANGYLSGRVIDPDIDPTGRLSAAAQAVSQMARARNVSREAICIAWLLRHPAHVVPVIGTMDPGRIASACRGDEVLLSREDWYQLLVAARGEEMP